MTDTVAIDGLSTAVTRDGAVVWPGFLDARQCDDMRRRASHLVASPAARHYPKSTRVWDLFRHGEDFVDLLDDTRLARLLTALLGAHYLLSDYSLNVVKPSQPTDDWHIDYPYNEMTTLTAGSLLGLQCVLALDAFTQRNGATQFVRGTHQPPCRPVTAAEPSFETFTAEPGSLLVMAAATWHRSGLNTTTSPRAAVLLSYVERWVRPMTDPPEPGPWARPSLRIALGMQRPPETINGVPVV